jgi:hypothetical protein
LFLLVRDGVKTTGETKCEFHKLDGSYPFVFLLPWTPSYSSYHIVFAATKAATMSQERRTLAAITDGVFAIFYVQKLSCTSIQSME